MLEKLIRRLEKSLLSVSEAQKAFSNAIVLVEKILAEVKSRNPQFELRFQLKEK